MLLNNFRHNCEAIQPALLHLIYLLTSVLVKMLMFIPFHADKDC